MSRPPSYPTIPKPQPGAPPKYVAAPVSAPATVARPKGIKLISVVGIVYAALLLIGTLLLVVTFITATAEKDPSLVAIKSDTILYTWFWFASATTFVLALALLLASVAARNLRPWAQTTLLVALCGWIILCAFALLMNVMFIYPLIRRIHQVGSSTNLALFEVTTLAAGGILGIVLPALMAVFLSRRHITSAFDRAGAGAAVV